MTRWPSLQSFWRNLLVRYMVVGVANTLFSYAVYATVLALGASFPVASLVSLAAGICLSFKTQGRLVFHNISSRLFGRFLLSWLLVYLAHIGVIELCLRLDVNAFVGGAAGMPSNVVVSFLLQRYFVFGRPRVPAKTIAVSPRGRDGIP